MAKSENKEEKFGLTISLAESQVLAIAALTKKRSKFIRFAIGELLKKVNDVGWDEIKSKIV